MGGELSQSAVPPASPQGQTPTQAPAASDPFAPPKLKEQAPLIQQPLPDQEAERRKQEEAQQQDLLRLQQQEAEHAQLEQDAERQREADADRERMLRELQEAEAQANALAPQPAGSVAAPVPPLPAEATGLAVSNSNVVSEPGTSSVEEAIGAEPLRNDLTRGEADASPGRVAALSPTPRLTAARAELQRTAAAINAHMGRNASTARAEPAAPEGDTGSATTNQAAFTAPNALPEAGKGELPSAPVHQPIPGASQENTESGSLPASLLDAYAAATAPGAEKLFGDVKSGRIFALDAVRILGGKFFKFRELTSEETATLSEAADAIDRRKRELSRGEKPYVYRPKALAGFATLSQSTSGAPRPVTLPPKNPEEASARIEWVKEGKGGKEEGRPYIYESKVAGFRPKMAPRLSATDGEVLVTIKFDGVEGLTMIDRKVSVSETDDLRWLMLRQSTLAAVNGFDVRWEVPDLKEAAKVHKMISYLRVKNVSVAVCEE